jgi:hypothetical protein
LLDDEIAKIDELMSEQYRLIGLLKEECHSVISHAALRRRRLSQISGLK